MKRKRLSAQARFRVLHEQDFKCALCTCKIPLQYHIDHIVPLWNGGTNERSNLQGVCVSCHDEKTGTETRVRCAQRRSRRRLTIMQTAKRILLLLGLCIGVRKPAARYRLGC